MGDDDWVSDTESVQGDTFNRANFQAVEASDTRPAVVRGTAKPDYLGVKPAFSDDPALAALQKEQYAQQEDHEYKQAVEIKKQSALPTKAPAAAPVHHETSESYAPPPIQASKPVLTAPTPMPERNPSTTIEGAERFAGGFSNAVIEFFNKMNEKSFTEQAVEYLNAYWDEVGDQAEFIFSVAHRVFTEADMHRQGITLYYKYEEGCNVDYPTYLYFYEKLVKFVSLNPEWRQGKYEKSAVYEVKTAIKHKKDLQEKVDVNFDGKISFLEYLLYQYNTFSNPAQFMERAMMAGDEHPAILEARLALEQVNRRIKEYEEERARLEEGAKLPGVKGLGFKHQLTILDVSPLAEELNKALITAEAAVRMAVRKFQGSTAAFGAPGGAFTPRGALWWMQRDLEEKKKYKKN